MKTVMDKILDMVEICPLKIKFIGETLGRDENHIEELARILEKHRLVKLNYPIVGNPFLTKIKGHEENGKSVVKTSYLVPYTIPFVADSAIVKKIIKNDKRKKESNVVPFMLPVLTVQETDNNGKKVTKESIDIVPYILPNLAAQNEEKELTKEINKGKDIVPAPVLEIQNEEKGSTEEINKDDFAPPTTAVAAENDNGKRIVQQKLIDIVHATPEASEDEKKGAENAENEAKKEAKEPDAVPVMLPVSAAPVDAQETEAKEIVQQN